MSYSYDPSKIKAHGKDQMRFELGDTDLSGNNPLSGHCDTCVLSDEEYEAVLSDLKPGALAWKKAKLQILDAVIHKLSLQVDTKIDVLEYKFSERYDAWFKLYNDLKSQISNSPAAPSASTDAVFKNPYFYTGMISSEFTLSSDPTQLRR